MSRGGSAPGKRGGVRAARWGSCPPPSVAPDGRVGFWRVSGDGFGGLGANECAPRTSRGQVRFLCPPLGLAGFGFVPL